MFVAIKSNSMCLSWGECTVHALWTSMLNYNLKKTSLTIGNTFWTQANQRPPIKIICHKWALIHYWIGLYSGEEQDMHGHGGGSRHHASEFRLRQGSILLLLAGPSSPKRLRRQNRAPRSRMAAPVEAWVYVYLWSLFAILKYGNWGSRSSAFQF